MFPALIAALSLFPQEPCVRPDLSAAELQGQARGVLVSDDVHLGRPALSVRLPPEAQGGNGATLVEIPVMLMDGVVEVDVAGAPGSWAGPNDRGFIGVTIRMSPDAERFEGLYIRPTNARADDQLRRNRSTQYFSFPDFPFDLLRRDAPGRYESYVDLVPGEWTRLRIAVTGQRAELFVNDAEQPALVVNDLKLEASAGTVGLWVDSGTDGHFANLKICPA
jgi:hypothetical protein